MFLTIAKITEYLSNRWECARCYAKKEYFRNKDKKGCPCQGKITSLASHLVSLPLECEFCPYYEDNVKGGKIKCL